MLKILQRLRPLRQLSTPASRRLMSSESTKVSDPLRVLFCGSDEFSCVSLQALHKEHVRNPELIKSIDVVVRPGKPTGRGYKTIREVPLKKLAGELNLPIHERDTFTGWTPPTLPNEPTNLIIAVSFGLFVPARLLRAAKYGGLNVHPSLLPDLRGPAPLQHALLAGRAASGVSLQTLSDAAFDAGEVLAQTPAPGVPVPPRCSLPQLRDLLAPLGAEMLVAGLQAGLHVPPRVPVALATVAAAAAAGGGWPSGPKELAHAPKIRPADRQVDWAAPGWAAAQAATRSRVLGPLWSRALRRSGEEKRLILEDVEEVEPAAWPEEIVELVRRMKEARERGADLDIAALGLKGVTWMQEVPVTTGGGNGSVGAAGSGEADLQLRQVTVPYHVDAASGSSEGGSAIIIPAIGGGCFRVRRIKVEGERSKPASRAIEPFASEYQAAVEDVSWAYYTWEALVDPSLWLKPVEAIFEDSGL